MKMALLELARPFVRTIKPVGELPTKPISDRWGYDRGTPVGRFFIEQFMERHASDISGNVLEIKNPRYINAFGSDLEQVDILDIDTDNSEATIYADLAAADILQSDFYDCIMLNETLQFVYDLKSAVGHVHRALKPGGVLLVTVPCIAQRDREIAYSDYWRFTDVLCQRLFGEAFGNENVAVESYGNYYSCVTGLTGMAYEETDQEAMEGSSGKYTQIVGVRAEKSSNGPLGQEVEPVPWNCE